ncbi:hypothetical protein A2334_00240 [Candidatus Roizmanbacteria bacterium RIFOXYB2_FULL_38_10]|uniref:Uncharacterized protein n=1 Tax=Candidatus Roizmanbacteria bacterium RIFOXYD1_FULL_38_12 TaxID=1802093 RepID=A0A1F7L2F8_9BACT|nr:MAG: hypothetical protein A3K47_05785 [Candidatus Roizmanbacteria bacterium RIFOXYA2_FULL_38_14]OGK64253.1 MAG: hypothetical protein A3K27_05785 [Candidatus Roizmanbacteria bacterium RIFOXYA1_FULL_37_12]OGK66099.1 MAG: hypothetical protein A3K38_05785 [Candidatus Roizmanbacteria bacterium RIFOXYB1_FULL_40_23]OGK67664.1 MAG: hypothetical protein A2334_00240 [Candidatus Roizmanbacteria bacterium RIFOXYB2_FULL_38_10]OGK70504.1 MAG: hypothetical protein A3K21_05790 [Candidatus Roizmanbacteria ba
MKKILFTIAAIIFIVFLLRFAIGGDEDTWICEKTPTSVGGSGAARWIKHGNPSYPSPVIPCSGTKPLGKTKEDCLAQGGVWEKQGPEPYETCDRKTIDRGNPCRDNNECEGWCQVDLTRDELNQGMRGELKTGKKIGQCSIWVVELGCFGMMEKGKVKVICID